VAHGAGEAHADDEAREEALSGAWPGQTAGGHLADSARWPRRPGSRWTNAGGPGQNSLFSLLRPDGSAQIVMITWLVIFDESFVVAGMNNPG
jgi:hypothetical protein